MEFNKVINEAGITITDVDSEETVNAHINNLKKKMQKTNDPNVRSSIQRQIGLANKQRDQLRKSQNLKKQQQRLTGTSNDIAANAATSGRMSGLA